MATRSLQEEIKQGRPFRSHGQELAIAILRTANALRRKLDAAVASEGITHQQYNVLRILRGAKGPLPTMEIAVRLIEETPGITRLVSALDDRGLLRRDQWAGDRRQVLCQITPAGLRLLEQLDAAIDELDDSTSTGLSDEQVGLILEALSAIRDRFSLR